MVRAIRIGAEDDVATLIEDAAVGDIVIADDERVVAREPVPRGHKIALAARAPGEPVIKYGHSIGRAAAAIVPGDHVHAHNLSSGLAGEQTYTYRPQFVVADAARATPAFMGYRRDDGRVGTRNEIWILPTVGCVARTAERIARAAEAQVAGLVDGVHAFAHPFGCSQLGDDLAATRAMLASLACHSNAGGVLILGLGCEENQLDALIAAIPAWRRPAVRTLGAQMATDELEEGVAAVVALARAAAAPRVPVPLDRLVLGVKCGGSDGLSGLTANPLVGRIADRVADAGGTVVQTEVPEMFGAEQVLMNRAADARVFEATAAMVNRFKRYFIDHGEPVSENPSPGNITGGITTLEEKSLGAVQKGGRATVTDVIGYGERVRVAGLTLLEAPGNDAVSCTALAAAGATMILFTTGRGTPLGFPVPTVKIATNSALAARKPGWIDFDAGAVIDDGFDVAEEALLDRVVAIAGGAETAAERNGEREIALWKRGVTL
jgi:altronate hydrolase